MGNTDILLAPGEKGLYSRDMRPNLVMFWLRTRMQVTNKRIAVKYPNTLFGVIPLGYEERSMPIGSVAGVTASFKVKGVALVVSTVMALLFLFGVFEASGGRVIYFALLFLLFAVSALNSIGPSLMVTNNGGGMTAVQVSILDKQALEDFTHKANEIIYSAASGGQSWQDAYASGTDNFQNRGSWSPDTQHPGSGTVGRNQGGQEPQPGGRW